MLTILGSCVAVCLWDEFASVGAMLHFALPRAPRHNCLEPFRFGDTGILAALESVERLGGVRARLRAKLFGGSGVMRRSDGDLGRLGVQNVDVAIRTLISVEVPLVVIETGGERGRKVLFHPDTGAAWVKQV